MRQVHLGLIGDNIRASRSPALHRYCGELCGLDVRYDLFIPPALGRPFEDVFHAMPRNGIVGTNITLPYKERAVGLVDIPDPATARIGAVNTVRFDPDRPRGFNTDCSGFAAAWRSAFADAAPGRVAMIGAGGVGKAVAFALAGLGASEIAFIERDAAKAAALARSVNDATGGATRTMVGGLDALHSADGVINCTPIGMEGYPGSPVPEGLFPRNAWAFDAVYTPVETPFRAQALAAGAAFLSGWELFFHQGIDAFEIFTGRRPDDLPRLRRMLGAPETRVA